MNPKNLKRTAVELKIKSLIEISKLQENTRKRRIFNKK